MGACTALLPCGMSRVAAVALVASSLLLAAACGNGAGPACRDTAPEHTGDGTFYGADGSGACGFDPTGDLMVAAMNEVDLAGSVVCGACVHVTGPRGEATVRIVDVCPGCLQGDIDLSQQAFTQLADPSLGRVKIAWRYTPCEVDGPIRYHFQAGSSEWWTAVQIRNARYAVDSLEVEKDGQYVHVPRAGYNYFVDQSGMGPGPYAFRVTDVRGDVLEDVGVPLVDAGDSPGAAQFPACY